MRRLIHVLIFCGLAWTLQGQSIYTEFGKNRVQFHDDFKDWWMYETENFITYWYGKGRNVAQTVIQLAELDNEAIQNVLEHRFNDKIEIIVYVDLTDMNQSNLGAEEIFTSNSGRTKILGNKMFVYFDGNHQTLRKRIRQGVAAIYLESMLYGSNLQEIVQNAVLLNLPDWYKEGLISFLGEEWSAEADDELRDLFAVKKKRYHDFDRLARDYPRIAGHSFWFYIAQYYGKTAISNLLYLTRINRNLENAFLYVLGTPYEQVVHNWQVYFAAKYGEEQKNLLNYVEEQQVRISNKRNARYAAMALSPDASTLAYVLNDRGKSKLYLRDVQSGQEKMLLKTGIRNNVQETDYNYPLLSWHPNSAMLYVLFESKDVLYLMEADLTTGERIVTPFGPEYQRVYAMDYWNEDTLAIAGATDGLSDLYFYFLKSRSSEKVTRDYFDDLEMIVTTIGGQKGLLFSSNRLSDVVLELKLDSILPIENYDLFFLTDPMGARRLRNLTKTPGLSEHQPQRLGTAVIYLTNESGVWNRKVIQDPSVPNTTSHFITNYNRNILAHCSNANSDLIFETTKFDQKYKLYMSRLEGLSQVAPHTIGRTLPDASAIRDAQSTEQKPSAPPINPEDEKYLFQSEFPEPAVMPGSAAEPEAQDFPGLNFLNLPSHAEAVSYDQSKVVEFNSARAVAHRLRFKLDYVNTTLDNSLLFNSLDSYAGEKREYENPPLGILLKANIKDLFEDYTIEGGARFPTTFNGSEYFLVVNDRKKRFDKQYAFYRKTRIENIENGLIGSDRNQDVTVIGQFTLTYPLDIYQSLRGTVTLRNDRFNKLSTDASNVNIPIDDDQRVGLKVEYVYDNTLEIDINYRHGTRAKVWTEVIKKFDLNLFERGEKLTFNEGFMTVFGVDARHYLRLDRHSIFAARIMASTSLGSERILYYLGGIENWLFSQSDNTIPVPSDKNFAYQTIAANMRGFKFNARNGSSVALANAELRVPFLRYLSKRKLKSSLFRHMQVVGFVDAGTAWHGKDPFSKENPLNTLTLTNPPTVQVDVKYFRNPIVVGYGAGVRTLLFGYFLKLDYAWGLETRRVNKPILYFSMGTDF